MITAEFINGPMDGEFVSLPGIVPQWHVPWVNQSLTDIQSGIYVYRLQHPGRTTIYDYDLKNEYVPYVFVEEQVTPDLFDLYKGEQK